jgi:hypothetical protein
MLRFEGEAEGFTLLKACANTADSFEFEVEATVVATFGNTVTF